MHFWLVLSFRFPLFANFLDTLFPLPQRSNRCLITYIQSLVFSCNNWKVRNTIWTSINSLKKRQFVMINFEYVFATICRFAHMCGVTLYFTCIHLVGTWINYQNYIILLFCLLCFLCALWIIFQHLLHSHRFSVIFRFHFVHFSRTFPFGFVCFYFREWVFSKSAGFKLSMRRKSTGIMAKTLTLTLTGTRTRRRRTYFSINLQLQAKCGLSTLNGN